MLTPRAHHPDPRLYRIIRLIVRVLVRLLTRTEIHGLENVPTHGSYIVLTNHLSAIDPPLLLAVMPAISLFQDFRNDFIPSS